MGLHKKATEKKWPAITLVTIQCTVIASASNYCTLGIYVETVETLPRNFRQDLNHVRYPFPGETFLVEAQLHGII